MRRRTTVACGLALMLSACSPPAPAPAPAAEPAAPPTDSQHAGITEPHGDHTAHHGGMVLMNGDVHYEVVMSTFAPEAATTLLDAGDALRARLA